MGEFCEANPDLGKVFTLWHSACSGHWKNSVVDLHLCRVLTKHSIETLMMSHNVKHWPKADMITQSMEKSAHPQYAVKTNHHPRAVLEQ